MQSHPLRGKGCADGERACRSRNSPRSSSCGPCRDLSGGIKEKAGAQPPIPGDLAAWGATKTPKERLPAPGTDGTAALLAGLRGTHPAQAQGRLWGTGLSVGRGAGGCRSLAVALPPSTWEGPGRKKQAVVTCLVGSVWGLWLVV